MADLRWVLLIAGLLILVGLFFWTRYSRQIRSRLDRSRRLEPALGDDGVVAGTGATDLTASPDLKPGPQVVTIRLLCPDAGGFPAEPLVLALRDAGLRHGRYGIFHLDPGGDDGPPRFSVANLVEPGSFDLTRLRTDRYPGVSLFLVLGQVPDAVGAFDTMMATARELARRLGGELVDEQGSSLSIQRERYLREEVIQFQLRHGPDV